ncbi:phage major capsid protein [Oscillospiraceae bacterium MB08-C2-2]|nr:phage major capsid protein [Oscillospiraceae bacterium MB08-C2-2]
MANYENVKIDKGFYKSAGGFSAQLERLDPTSQYAGTQLEGLDAFQRQLKRFDIKVSGPASDIVAKFFSTGDSAALFPEYVARAVGQGARENSILEQIIAARTDINALDYRSILTKCAVSGTQPVAEGAELPESVISLKEDLVRLSKYGCLLSASYEAIKFQRIDLFSVALSQSGDQMVRSQLAKAIKTLLDGDGHSDAAAVTQTAAAGILTYQDLIRLWAKYENFELNTLLASPDMVVKMLGIPEFQNPQTGLNFQGTGTLSTPLGARLIKCSAVPAGTVIGLDKRYALEMVCAGGVTVEHDKLINTQLERAAITSIVGFSKIFPEAVQALKLKS